MRTHPSSLLPLITGSHTIQEKRRRGRRGRRRPKEILAATMRRVSSRQRLVSWDAFDADSNDCSSNSSDREQNNLVVTSYERSLLGGMRKRTRVERREQLELLEEAKSFHDLCDDVKLYVTSFLSISDARSFMSIHKHQNSLVRKSRFLWRSWCLQQWPQITPTTTSFRNEASLDYSTILHAASSPPPTKIDTTKFHKRRANRMFRTLNGDPNVIQYLGQVGTGDRCFRSNRALARPTIDKNGKRPKQNQLLWKMLLSQRKPDPVPFCAPFLYKNEVCFVPRLVSYFEISILNDGPAVPTTTTANPFTPAAAVDCVAIGLSRQDFRCSSRMPGWDSWSFGYHGDDGGIFHASGDMLRAYGPSFGKGDTIGCGVDYRGGHVFFTHNGTFLGFAWSGLEVMMEGMELIPTIGVDSNAPVECNFGQRNFSFDLLEYIEKDVVVV